MHCVIYVCALGSLYVRKECAHIYIWPNMAQCHLDEAESLVAVIHGPVVGSTYWRKTFKVNL